MTKLIYLIAAIFFIALINACTTDAPSGDEEEAAYFREAHRPQFHYSPDSMWMNDPNGMVYYEGEYHLFYQYYPDSTVWGPMHWGHAVSTDLVHWEHLPIGLYPDSLGLIFSGSAVVDWNNTSGLGEDGKPPLIAIFTHHLMAGEKAGRNDYQYQSIAYSLDKGRTWTKYEGNPVIPNPGIRDFRDPKVFWHDASGRWVMIFAAGDHVKLYASPNLKEWQFESEFGAEIGAHGGVWECPDLFELAVDGDNSNKKWALLLSINPGGPNGGSGTQYFVGDFDGRRFTLDPSFAADLAREDGIPDGMVFADFEKGNYEGWEVTGTAFGAAPAAGAFEGQQTVRNLQGKYLANSFSGGDAAVGKLLSPSFQIETDYIHFRIGGGNHPGEVALNLLSEGKILRTVTGHNSESLAWASWDVSAFKGQPAQLEIIDKRREGWGHILVDHILFSDEPMKEQPHPGIWLDYGRDNYAGVTWSDIPAADGRRLFIGWMSNWDYANVVPTHPWRSAMTVSRVLELKQTPAGYRLFSNPVEELKTIKGPVQELPEQDVAGSLNLSDALEQPTPLMEVFLELEWEAGAAPESAALVLSNTIGESLRVGVLPRDGRFFIDRTGSGKTGFAGNFAEPVQYAPWEAPSNRVVLQVLVDVSSVELFADEGAAVMTSLFFPNEDFTTASLEVEGGTLRVKKATVAPMQPIWNK